MKHHFAIVHLSDTHFGEEWYTAWTKHAAPAAPAAPPTKLSLQGFFQHDFRACQRLQDEVNSYTKFEGAHCVLALHTGDVTAEGADSEFVLGVSYLRGALRRSWKRAVGLGSYCNWSLAVPGNHDHWKTRRRNAIFATLPNAIIHDTYFPGAPGANYWHWSKEIDGIQLQVMGVDSCSRQQWQWLANGKLDVKALLALAGKVREADRKAETARCVVVRVLAMHHSLKGGMTHRLDPTSITAVRRFCSHNKIHFVLTGHMHVPLLPSSPTLGGHPNPTGLGIEIRCGTSTQGAPPGKMAVAHGNTFLLHTIEKKTHNGHFQAGWHTRAYQRLSDTGPFARAPTLDFKKTIS